MAKGDIYVYELSDKGKKAGRHSFSLDGETFKADKYGIVRVPHPGLPHPDAHDLTHVHTEGNGAEPFVLGKLVELHNAVVDAEKNEKEALAVVADAQKTLDAAKGNDRQVALKNLNEAKDLAAEASKAVADAKKLAAGGTN